MTTHRQAPSPVAAPSSLPFSSPSSSSSGAQYLLRIDDLTPRMEPGCWPALVALIRRHALQPILAVIPDCQDPALNRTQPDPQFWPELRALQQAGAAIGLHGYRHLCQPRGYGLVPMHRSNEFVGLPAATQHDWIRHGIQLLHQQELTPTLWVAPRHGFDRTTLQALQANGIRIVSDGFGTAPYRRLGCIWLPQQLWQPRLHARGLWTLCIHPATLTPTALASLASFLDQHAHRFTSVPRVLNEWSIPAATLGTHLQSLRGSLRLHARRLLRPQISA